MMNYFLVILVVTFCAQMYSYTANLGKVRRVFDGLDFSVVQGCVNGIQKENQNEYGPYFVYPLLRTSVEQYFVLNLKPVYKRNQFEYLITLTDPYTVNNAQSQYYKGVSITFQINYYQGCIYSNQKKFIIKEKTQNGN